MARFRGDVHAGSDRAAATILFLILLAIALLVAWWIINPVGFTTFWNNLSTPNLR